MANCLIIFRNPLYLFLLPLALVMLICIKCLLQDLIDLLRIHPLIFQCCFSFLDRIHKFLSGLFFQNTFHMYMILDLIPGYIISGSMRTEHRSTRIFHITFKSYAIISHDCFGIMHSSYPENCKKVFLLLWYRRSQSADNPLR